MPDHQRLDFVDDFDGHSVPPLPCALDPLLDDEADDAPVHESAARARTQTRAAYRKLDFPESFDDPVGAFDVSTPMAATVPTTEMVEALKEQGRIEAADAYARGIADGREQGMLEARAAAEALLAASIASIADALPAILETADGRREAFEREAARLACAIVRSLAPSVAARLRKAQMSAFIVDCLRAAVPSPVVEVRVGPGVLSEIEDRVAALTAEAGVSNGVTVCADDDLSPGAARVTWAGGGAAFDQSAALRDVLGGLDAVLANLVRE